MIRVFVRYQWSFQLQEQTGQVPGVGVKSVMDPAPSAFSKFSRRRGSSSLGRKQYYKELFSTEDSVCVLNLKVLSAVLSSQIDILNSPKLSFVHKHLFCRESVPFSCGGSVLLKKIPSTSKSVGFCVL